jgi:adenosine deaminase
MLARDGDAGKMPAHSNPGIQRGLGMNFSAAARFFGCCAFSTLLFDFSAAAAAQTARPATPRSAVTPAEQRTSRKLDSLRNNPLDLRAFLYGMPKGADLHNHIFGAVYAESWIRDAAEDRLCVNLASLALVQPKSGKESGSCEAGQVPAARAYQDQHLYDSLINAFSMRGFVPSPGVTGHDHFFGSFAKFGIMDLRHLGKWLDELSARAAAQNEQYLELMHTPDFAHAAAIASTQGWRDDFSQMREALLARGLRDDVAAARKVLDDAEAARRQLQHCGQQGEVPGCRVQIRFLYQVLRGLPREIVFAQTLLAFEAASVDPHFVGINFVMPEDCFICMSDYGLHMRMVDFFHGLYPKVHITLHAGEIAPGLVTYEGLCCHIRMAVEQAHAERIGHGVDVMYEDRPYELLKKMATKHVMVEINFTSNDVILGVTGKEHPFPIYRQFGVPVALSTDDEGVSRIDLTHEYVRAVQTYDLHYADLKQLVRTGMEHNFLPGSSLWRDADVFTRTVSACSQDVPGAEKPSSACAAFLRSSEKAQQQWELERRFRVFESAD